MLASSPSHLQLSTLKDYRPLQAGHIVRVSKAEPRLSWNNKSFLGAEVLPWLDMVPKSVLGAPDGDVGLESPELVPPPLRPCSWRQWSILEQHHTATNMLVG